MLLSLIQSFVSYTSASGSEPSKLAAATAVGARRAPLARPPPRSPGMKWMAPPRSHPELPLLVEIGIESCLGIVLGDTTKSSLTKDSHPRPPRSHPGPCARHHQGHRTEGLRLPQAVQEPGHL